MTLLLKPVPPARHLLRAKDLIDARYREPLDVPALARAARLSPAHFSREFRRAFGETPHQYLLTRRLERAAALLRNTDHTVADICFAVGLHSVGSFTTSFGRAFGHARRRRTAPRYPPAASRARIPTCVLLAWAPSAIAAVFEKTVAWRPANVGLTVQPRPEGTTMLKNLTNVQVVGPRPGRGPRLLHREARHGAARRTSRVPELGNFRWLTVGVPGQPDVAITLMAMPGPPVFDEETRPRSWRWWPRAPPAGLFFATDDFQATLRGAQGPRRRVPAGADRAALRHRRGVPRPVRQPDADGPAELVPAEGGHAVDRAA